MSQPNKQKVEDKKVDLTKSLTAEFDGVRVSLHPGQQWNKETKKGTYDPNRMGSIMLFDKGQAIRLTYSQAALFANFLESNKDFVRHYIDIEVERGEKSRRQLEEATKF